MRCDFVLFVFVAALGAASPGLSAELGFAEDAGQIIEQMVGNDTIYGPTRSFSLTGAQPIRSVRVQARDSQGQISTQSASISGKEVSQNARLKIEFDVNSTVIRASAYPLLAELGKALADPRLESQPVCIKGHTDSDGGDVYNLRLSFGRAEAVRQYLVGASAIAPERLGVLGFGESLPLVANNSAGHKQLNRRVEVSLNCPELGR